MIARYFLRAARSPIWERSLQYWTSFRLTDRIHAIERRSPAAGRSTGRRSSGKSAETRHFKPKLLTPLGEARKTLLRPVAVPSHTADWRSLSECMSQQGSFIWRGYVITRRFQQGGNFLMQRVYGTVTTVAFKVVGGLGSVVAMLGSASKAMADACM